MISKRIKTILENRDAYCWHCGEEQNLVIHHRKNRQMGGSKLLDHPTNLLLVCSYYNSMMESDSGVAEEARGWGHKLESWQEFSDPVYDRCDGEWYELLDDGTKKKYFNTIITMF